MKRYLESTHQAQISLSDLIHEIDAIVVCDDAASEDPFQYIRSSKSFDYIESSKSFDYNKLSIEEAIKLDDVNYILRMLKDCYDIYRQRYRPRDDAFSDSLRAEGIVIRDSDVERIVKQLHVKDFSHGKYSYEVDSWCHLWAVFEFNDSYTFHDKEGNEIIKQNFRIYIKLDSEENENGTVAVISFHDPEFNLSHPYLNYPPDKE